MFLKVGRFPLLLAALALLSACGINPVTGKKEIQFVSEAQELQIGEQNYAPTRQGEGGDLTVLPELTTYVNGVGQKLAAVADRKLPYEFVVLNNSVPNAWALPGGKIAVNRGLLTELKNEAELAAVLGHEIVHAAARHGAKAQERGTMMQIGMAAAQVGAAVADVDPNLANLALRGAGAGLQMIQMKYGRDQELESDLYGMKYMKLAGYDPSGAVTLAGNLRAPVGSWRPEAAELDGRPVRVASALAGTCRQEHARLRMSWDAAAKSGNESFAAATRQLRQLKPAYDKYDQAMAAAQKKDFATAQISGRTGSASHPPRRQLPGPSGSDRPRREAAAGRGGSFREGDAAEPKLFRLVPGRRRRAGPAGQQDQGGAIPGRAARSCCLPHPPRTTWAISRAIAAITEAARKYYQAAASRRARIGRGGCGRVHEDGSAAEPRQLRRGRRAVRFARAGSWWSSRIGRRWRCMLSR